MPWPTLNECERWVDWSWYQKDLLNRPFDVDSFLELHSEVEGAFIRAIWPGGAKDSKYGHYYDGFKKNGRKVAAYLWANPNKSFSRVMDDWEAALGDRVPPLLGRDWEEQSGYSGKSDQFVTDNMKGTIEAAEMRFPNAVWIDYSRAGWLDSRIIHGSWMDKLIYWMAHWLYPPPGFNRQAEAFSEVDALLPISNNFTPWRGRNHGITIAQVKGWQISSRGKIVPRSTSDMDYFLKSFLDPIYGDGNGQPPTQPDPIPVEVRVPAGKATVTVIET